MREIKFRGWNGRSMEYGGFSIHATAGKIEPSIGLSDMKEDSPVMQYTGIKDKNGKDIYEGDVLKFDEDEYGDADSMFVVEWSENSGSWIGLGVPSEWPKYCKIIGNKYQKFINET